MPILTVFRDSAFHLLAALALTQLFGSLALGTSGLAFVETGVPVAFVVGSAAVFLVLAAGGILAARHLVQRVQTPPPGPAPDAFRSDVSRQNAPWMARSKWRTPVQSTQARLSLAGLSVGILLGGGAAFFPLRDLADSIAYAVPMAPGDWWWAPLLIGTGMALALVGMPQVARACRFGHTTLELRTHPGRLGRRLEAIVHTSIPPEQSPEDSFDVHVKCSRHSSEYDYEKVKWEETKAVRPRSTAGGTLTLPVAFTLPGHLPETTLQQSTRIVWTLSVHGDMPGIDYKARFEIPVFAPDEEDDRTPGTDVDDARRAATLSEPTVTEGRPSSRPSSHRTLTTERIAMRRLPGGGVRFRFGPGGALFATFLFGGFSVLSGVIGLALLGDGQIFAGLLSFLFAFGMGFAALGNQFKSAEVAVKDGCVEVQTHLPWSTEEHTLRADELADVQLALQGSSLGKNAYRILLVPSAPSKIASLKGKQWQRDATAGVFGALRHVKGAQRPGAIAAQQLNTIPVAQNLWDREEAEWIAAQILAAAESQASSDARSSNARSSDTDSRSASAR